MPHAVRGAFATIATTVLTASLIGVAAPAAAGSPAYHGMPGSAGCGTESYSEPGASETHTLTSGGARRSYVLHVPDRYDGTVSTPVILAFHGRKSTGAEIEEFSGLSRLDAIVAYPNGLADDEGKTGWAGAPYSPEADDIGFVRNLLSRLSSRLCVDQKRVYATGKSNGGGFTALLACAMPNRIAAFAPVAGAFYPQSTEGCRPGPPVPMLEFHGTADTIIEYEGGESHGERFPSIPAWLSRWAAKDHCRTSDEQAVGHDVTELSWSDCAAGTDVVHYRIQGAGHTWPGERADSGPGSATQTISATDVMWQFFLDHPLRPRCRDRG